MYVLLLQNNAKYNLDYLMKNEDIYVSLRISKKIIKSLYLFINFFRLNYRKDCRKTKKNDTHHKMTRRI